MKKTVLLPSAVVTLSAVILVSACTKTDEKTAPVVRYSALYVASQHYKKNTAPYKALGEDCEREMDQAKSCGGKAREWFGTGATDRRSTPEKAACLQEIRLLPSCKVLAESGLILVSITAQRVNGEAHGRKVYGDKFIELQD
jgi:hypothetical protein